MKKKKKNQNVCHFIDYSYFPACKIEDASETSLDKLGAK